MTDEKRNKMIEDNLALVTYSLQLLGIEYNEDYFQQGVLELIRCVDNFDEKKGRKFSTYAINNIKWYLKEYIQRDYVIKPKRMKPRTGKVDILFCDSLDRTIDTDGKNITLGETISDSRNLIKHKMEQLDQEDFFNYALEEFDLTEEEINLFKDFHFNGWDKKRALGKRYGLTPKQLTLKLNDIKLVLQEAYLSYNDIRGG